MDQDIPGLLAEAPAPEAAASKRGGARSAAKAAALPQDFETALADLEALVAQMEEGSLPLESSLTAYKRGVDLVRVCQERLARAEQQVRVLEGDLLKPLDNGSE